MCYGGLRSSGLQTLILNTVKNECLPKTMAMNESQASVLMSLLLYPVFACLSAATERVAGASKQGQAESKVGRSV